jgi:hypothetical protein
MPQQYPYGPIKTKPLKPTQRKAILTAMSAISSYMRTVNQKLKMKLNLKSK